MSRIWGLAALVASHRKSSGFVCGHEAGAFAARELVVCRPRPLRGATSQSSASTTFPKGAMHRPALTRVAIGARVIGQGAARLLLRRIRSRGSAREHRSAAKAHHSVALRGPRSALNSPPRGARTKLGGRSNGYASTFVGSDPGAMIAFGALPVAPATADAVADAKAAVAKYAGPQTTWEGPTKGPKPEAGKRSSSFPATSRTTSPISTGSTSSKPGRSSDGTSPSSTGKEARLPGSRG